MRILCFHLTVKTLNFSSSHSHHRSRKVRSPLVAVSQIVDKVATLSSVGHDAEEIADYSTRSASCLLCRCRRASANLWHFYYRSFWPSGGDLGGLQDGLIGYSTFGTLANFLESSSRCHHYGSAWGMSSVIQIVIEMGQHTGSIEHILDSVSWGISILTSTDLTLHYFSKDKQTSNLQDHLISQLPQEQEHFHNSKPTATNHSLAQPNHATIPHRLHSRNSSRLQGNRTDPHHVYHTILSSFQQLGQRLRAPFPPA